MAEPDRLTYLHDAGEGDDANAFFVRVRFDEVDGRTRVRLRLLFPSVAACEAARQYGAVEGGQQTLARLDGWIASQR